VTGKLDVPERGHRSVSPELLGARHSRFDGFGFGHVATHRLADMRLGSVFGAVDREIQDGVAMCKRSCSYFRWCGGGAPANKLFETGRFDATETMHCRLVRQVMLDEVLAGIEARTRSVGAENDMDHIGASSRGPTTRNEDYV
jgi:radical SAM protein with 4Fe4S-binding SPASM domain